MKNSNIIDWSKITWEQFEVLCRKYLEKKFCQTDHNLKLDSTPYRKDGGKDIVISMQNPLFSYKVWAECKMRSTSLDLDDIGKNIVLVISKNINKIIFLSSSPIRASAKLEITNVSAKHNFEVSFLDGKTLEDELCAYPELIRGFFLIQKLDDYEERDNLQIEYSLSEFESDTLLLNNPSLELKRDIYFYIHFFIKNLSGRPFFNVTAEINNKDSCDIKFSDYQEPIIEEIKPMSDVTFTISCKILKYSGVVKIPNISVNFGTSPDSINGPVLTKKIEFGVLKTESLQKIPLTGKRVHEFLTNELIKKTNLAAGGRTQIVDIRGVSGVGKSRILKEISNICRNKGFNIQQYDFKLKKTGIISKIISKLLVIPFSPGNIRFGKEDLKNILKERMGSSEYIEPLFNLVTNELNWHEEGFYYKRLLTHFLENPVHEQNVYMAFDNVQEANQVLINLLIHILDHFINNNHKIMIILSTNTEAVPLSNIDSINNFLQFLDTLREDFCDSISGFNCTEFSHSDAKTFVINTFSGIHDYDPFIDRLLKKTGMKPLDIVMMYKHLQDNGIITWAELSTWYVSDLEKFYDFYKSVPEDMNSILMLRVKNHLLHFDDKYASDFKKVISALVQFDGIVSSGFIEYIDVSDSSLDKMLHAFFIRFDDYSDDIVFYHDNLHRYFEARNEYKYNKKIAGNAIKWLNNQDSTFVQNRDTIFVSCILTLGNYIEAEQMALELMENYLAICNFSKIYDIGKIMYEAPYRREPSVIRFKLLWYYGKSMLEFYNYQNGIKIYQDTYNFLQTIKEALDTNTICDFYHEYANAYIDSFEIDKSIEALKAFKKVANRPDKYNILIEDRLCVCYRKQGNLKLAMKHINNAIGLAEEYGDSEWLSIVYSDLAAIHVYITYEKEEIKAAFGKAVEYYKMQRAPVYWREIEILTQRAKVYILDNELANAWQALQNAEMLSEKYNYSFLLDVIANCKAFISYKNGDLELAEKLLIAANRECEKYLYKDALWRIMNNLGCIFYFKGNLRKAIHYYEFAMEIYKGRKSANYSEIDMTPIMSNLYLAHLKMNNTTEVRKTLLKLKNKNLEKLYSVIRADSAEEYVKHLPELSPFCSYGINFLC